MAIAEPYNSPSPSWLETLIGFFKKPARLQVAALCYRLTDHGPEILLLTSRGKGRWILPKGWPELHFASHVTASIEAFEEAGIRGEVEPKPYASFKSHKGLEKGIDIRTNVLVYLVRVTEELEEYPEKGQRKVKWFPVADAVEQVDEPALKPILEAFGKDMTGTR